MAIFSGGNKASMLICHVVNVVGNPERVSRVSVKVREVQTDT